MTASDAASSLIQPNTDADILKLINEAIDKNTTESDIRFSRLAIAQRGSPEVAKKYPGYEDGMILDNLTREILSVKGKPPWLLANGVDPKSIKDDFFYCLIAFCFKLPSEYIKWIPKTEQQPGGDRWEFKTLEPKDPRVIEGTWISQGGKFKGKKPPVTINTNYLVGVIDEQMKMMNGNFRVSTFARTSSPCGQTAASLLQSHKMQRIYPWDRCYYLYTVQHDKPEPHHVFQLARGPLLKDVVDDYVPAQFLQMGQGLTGPNGDLFQSIIISSATLGGDEQHETTDSEVSSGNQQSATEDPFADPTKGGAEKAPNF